MDLNNVEKSTNFGQSQAKTTYHGKASAHIVDFGHLLKIISKLAYKPIISNLRPNAGNTTDVLRTTKPPQRLQI